MSANILVIEDEDDINELVSMNLRDMSHSVDSCQNGRIGLEMALGTDRIHGLHINRIHG